MTVVRDCSWMLLKHSLFHYLARLGRFNVAHKSSCGALLFSFSGLSNGSYFNFSSHLRFQFGLDANPRYL